MLHKTQIADKSTAIVQYHDSMIASQGVIFLQQLYGTTTVQENAP